MTTFTIYTADSAPAESKEQLETTQERKGLIPSALKSDSRGITLWQAVDPANAVQFDRKNHCGLHHFALKVDSEDALQALHRKLSATDGVEIEFAPEPLGDIATHMMCFIPGGIRTEFIALPN